MTVPLALIPAARLPRRRIDRQTAGRLARLSRGAHRFHRFAHHPLCDRYAGEVVRIGRRGRLCRGCTYAIAGAVIGGAAGLVVASAPVMVPVIATATGAVMLLSTLWSRRRVTKVSTRLIPAALFALAMTTGVSSAAPLGLAAAFAAAAIVGGLRLLYGKRGADRRPCSTCPERARSPCSGFAPIVSRERAFQRVARGMLR
jgi:hypothetical protein